MAVNDFKYPTLDIGPNLYQKYPREFINYLKELNIKEQLTTKYRVVYCGNEIARGFVIDAAAKDYYSGQNREMLLDGPFRTIGIISPRGREFFNLDYIFEFVPRKTTGKLAIDMGSEIQKINKIKNNRQILSLAMGLNCINETKIENLYEDRYYPIYRLFDNNDEDYSEEVFEGKLNGILRKSVATCAKMGSLTTGNNNKVTIIVNLLVDNYKEYKNWLNMIGGTSVRLKLAAFCTFSNNYVM